MLNCLLKQLNRPEHKRAIQRPQINAVVRETAAATPQLVRGKTMGHRQSGFLLIETYGFAQQQPGHHPGEERQMALAADMPVLMQEVGVFTLEPDSGIHERLDLGDYPNL